MNFKELKLTELCLIGFQMSFNPQSVSFFTQSSLITPSCLMFACSFTFFSVSLPPLKPFVLQV